MILFDLDRSSPTPLSRQILDRTRELIAAGSVRPGALLPSTRELASRLGVHRSTVSLAYQELWSLGYVELRQGARPRVRGRKQIVSPEGREPRGSIDWRELSAPGTDTALRHHAGYLQRRAARQAEAGSICFGSLDLDPRLFPHSSFRTCLKHVLAQRGDALLGYGDAMGYRPLREHLRARLAQHGIRVGVEEVLLTSGAQHASDLLLRVIAAPGRSVAVEAPTYDCMLPLLAVHGLRPLEIPLREDGMDLDALERCLIRERPLLVYSMPSFQNPSGICTPQAHRERLLSLCETHRTLLLEDGYEEEMQYSGKVVLAVKSMDRQRVVVYCGTFSKVLFPGARVGWVVADPQCIERMAALRRVSEIAPSTIVQAALHELCVRGHYDRHLSRMHRTFRRRMHAAQAALREQLDPRLVEWSEPRGGYLIWLRLRGAEGVWQGLDELLAAHGVELAHGHSFFPAQTSEHYLRLSISALDEAQITEGIRRLGCALREAHESGAESWS